VSPAFRSVYLVNLDHATIEMESIVTVGGRLSTSEQYKLDRNNGGAMHEGRRR
jgi:hypothetical protein